ncbi:PREDICTED: scavenger receptor cysteine-rich type 1 protein M130-like, partial [Eurypyga helias]|uniref:scavenger receptor cysteine-rich type 1 protein M130-like n=1 Tax=Eurypyga helias TaxID=54383 RepID=UPI000528894E
AADVRLENGGGCCTGRVEVKHQDQWRTMCSDSRDMLVAAVVCKQLGCGSAVEAPKHDGWGQHDCDHYEDAGVTCSGFIQLVRGECPCSGHMEIHDEDQWKTVCDSDFDLKAADVVCQELQVHRVVVVNGSTACEGKVEVQRRAFLERNWSCWRESFHCVGTEAHLGQCPVTALWASPCFHENDTAVMRSVLLGQVHLSHPQSDHLLHLVSAVGGCDDDDDDDPLDPGPVDQEMEPDLYPPDPHNQWEEIRQAVKE